MGWSPSSVVQEISYLSDMLSIPCSQFRHFIVSANKTDPIVSIAKVCLRYTPDTHLTWIVTYIKARMFNPSLYTLAGLAATGGQVGDMRSDDTDWNGLMNGWINVQGTPLWAQNAVPTTAFLNVPVLFAFQGGRKVTIVVQRNASSLPIDPFQLQFAVHGYLVQGNALQMVSMNATQIEEHTVA